MQIWIFISQAIDLFFNVNIYSLQETNAMLFAFIFQLLNLALNTNLDSFIGSCIAMNELRDLCIHALQAAVNAAQPYQRVRDVSLI